MRFSYKTKRFVLVVLIIFTCFHFEIFSGGRSFLASWMATSLNELGSGVSPRNLLNPSPHLEDLPAEDVPDTPPYIYVITPTYTRHMQKAELIRMSQTLLLIKNLHWIVVEDSNSTTAMVARLLQESGLKYTHLNVNWPRPPPNQRGVLQRDAAIAWIRGHVPEEDATAGRGGVVYFGDDDNTYHRQLFEEIRTTQTVSIFPVGFIADRSYEGPICKNNTVTGFLSGWVHGRKRKFQIDMAGFAINVRLFFEHPDAKFVFTKENGVLETSLLESLQVTMEMLEPRGDMCTKVLVWHTKSVNPKVISGYQAPSLEV